MGILQIKDATLKLNGGYILDHLSLDLQEGHIHAIIGPNGAGKSTLAMAIMGLGEYAKVQGDILFEGESIKGLSIDERARRGIVLGWQEPARFEGLKVETFINAGARNKTIKTAWEALKAVGLEPQSYISRAVDKTLSGGERKRIELASILAMRPKLVLLDEPDSGIDVEALERIFDALRTLKQQGTTVVLITHSLTVLQQAEHAFLLCHGRIIDKGSIERIAGYFQNKCLACDHKNMPEMNGVG
jgi:Fe-S cluster assembly ATP-binding protein